MSSPTRILFVCLGNICRSPLAEALFIHHSEKNGLSGRFEADSAGTSNYHEGEKADSRTRKNAISHGIEITHRSRPFSVSDFEYFDLILAMDSQNLSDILALSTDPDHHQKTSLLLDFLPGSEGKPVPDPWYGGEEGFEQVYNLLDLATRKLLEHLLRNR